MFALRCTKRLLTRLRVEPDPSPPPPTTKLGDWYANLIHYGRLQLILCVSERTFLPVILEARGADTIVPRLHQGVGEMLLALGIAENAIGVEMQAMADVVVAKTASKQVLGMLNNFAFLLEAYLERGPTLLKVALKIADAPCGPLGMESPDRVTKAAFTVAS